ncbi:MAG: DNA starvation/stationary phase protection protein [Defluviitaleaceae bacterium]|nr:DNA starvation/stationary phase protection protein [Defluviitaleaceae bacterium]
MDQVVNILNEQLSNWHVLFVKLHNYHWNVKGSDFFTLHEKFEMLYNEAAGHIDELAERILALGAKPAGSFKAYLALSTVAEATGNESSREMVEQIIVDFKTVVASAKSGIEAASEIGDETTVDLFTQIHVALEKHIWLFTAFLG